jgi:hypothetical protein
MIALDQLLNEHEGALAGATDEDRAQLAAELAVMMAPLGRPDRG